VTRKISSTAARIKLGMEDKLVLGNLDARRDWGHAREYVKAMWMMLQQENPDDFIIATGETHSVRDFCEKAFSHLGLDYRDHVQTDPLFYRPAEINLLLGDCSKARKALGWSYNLAFEDLVSEMVDEDMKYYEGMTS
jgi:GDPmannose 4,6-dehydratase